MDATRDPDLIENSHILMLAPLAGSRVLEIGCADGEMTWRYAGAAESVVGLDPNGIRLRKAIRERPTELQSRVTLVRARGEVLPFRNGSFDLAIFGWSL